ncbi:phosphatidylserine decarboxylase [Herbaspirillum sp. HC18]|nr:phosphatidylserine decarboxylase [Herbaspirillum sp. HC18]
MNNYPQPVIAPEGWPYLGIAVAAAMVASFVAGAWAFPLWLVALMVLQSFRDRARLAPRKPNAVLSPADGRIVAMEKAKDPYTGRIALKISVFMNLFNVHSNRVPVDGKIQSVQYFPGKRGNNDLGMDGSENERNAMVIAADNGQTVTCVQVAGRIARRILCHVKTGDVLKRGQRYGFVRFGSRVDVYLPLFAMPKVAVGDKVSATETILAEL